MIKALNLDSIKANTKLKENKNEQKQVLSFFLSMHKKYVNDLIPFHFNPGLGLFSQWHANPISPELTIPRIIQCESPQPNEVTFVNGNIRRTISVFYNYSGPVRHVPGQQNAIMVYINQSIWLFIPINGSDYRLKCISTEIQYVPYKKTTAYSIPYISYFFAPSWGIKRTLFIHELGNFRHDVTALQNALWYEVMYLITK